MEEVVIVSAKRTPIGKFGGQFKELSAVTLGTIAAKAACEAITLNPHDIDLAYFGNVLQTGSGQNPARQVALHTGMSYHAPATTINEVCGSGLKALLLGAQAIRLGEAQVVLVGGMESMSQAPYYSPSARWGARYGHVEQYDSIVIDGLQDAFNHEAMGMTAERVANQFNISREAQDAFAYFSQQKAARATQDGSFNDEIAPVEIPSRKGEPVTVTQDEGIRGNVTIAQLQQLAPVFIPETGTVTAGNASSLNDGASALILMHRDYATAHGYQPLASLVASAEVGIDPHIMGYAPVGATKQALAKAQLTIHDMAVIESNEAFAAQSLAVAEGLAWDANRVNVNGGAIALGHPIGASGARIVTTLVHALHHRQGDYGLATLCVGGGIGLSLIIKRI